MFAACVLKGSHLDRIYVNDLSQGLRCNAKLFGGNKVYKRGVSSSFHC